jgi:Fungal specific transcription factor domain
MSMSARITSANAVPNTSQGGASVSDNTGNAYAEQIHENNHLSQSYTPQQDINQTQALPDFSSLQPNFPMNSQGGMSFSATQSMFTPDFSQEWGSWTGLDDPGIMFRESPSLDDRMYVPMPKTPASLNFSQEQNAPVSNGQKRMSDVSRANHELSPDASYAESASRRESSAELSKGEKVRSHEMANGSNTDVLDDVTRQLSSRLGRLQIAEDGQPRYYGATSNLHILHSGPQSLYQPNIRNVFTHGDAAIVQAGLQWEEDSEYEENLLNLFFSWHNTFQYVCDKEIFSQERKRCKAGQTSDLYSPALANAIYSIGAAYADRSHSGLPDDAAEFFGLRAKAYLDIEIDSPSIATAQGLLILSSHEASCARDSRGWIYAGMAVQIISDLGLHLDLESEYSRLGTRGGKDEDVAILRRNIFWSANTIDTQWSAYSGRPSIMKSIVHNVQRPLPSRTYKWDYYTEDESSMGFPTDFDFYAAANVHVYLSKLMTIMSRVAEVLYSGIPDMSNDIHAFVAREDGNFRTWLSSLPASLQVNTSEKSNTIYIPGIIELHLQYHEAVILLHRPLIASTDSPAPSPESQDQSLNMTTLPSFQHCIHSAREICRLLIMFRRRYSLRRPHHHIVHMTMTASLIHVFHLCLSAAGSSENKEAQRCLLTCIHALGEMGQTYKSASRALDVVTSLRQSWQHDLSAGDVFKRARHQ